MFVVEILEAATTKEAVAKILDEAVILKRGGGAAFDLFICVRDAAQLPMKPPLEARLDNATLEACVAEERALEEAKKARSTDDVNTCADKGRPKPFFVVVLTQARDRGLSRDELNYLAVVKELLIGNDPRAITKAGEIHETYLSSARDDSAVLAALEAFARFCFASCK